jgi:hypothetical protein
MKKLLFLAFFMCFYAHTNAQDNNGSEDARLPKALDSLLIDIDKSTVTSGIIYERTLQLANLYNFNKVDSLNTANYGYYKQSLLELHRASNATRFISVDSLKSNLNKNAILNVVNIGILNTEFNIINYNEENPNEGGLKLNTATKKFEQIPNKPPFYLMHNTIIAPLADAVDGSEITFKFSNEYFFTNGNKTIKKLDVDFGNGTVVNVISNVNEFIPKSIPISYSTSGTKVLTFTIVYNDDSVSKTYGAIYIHSPIASNTIGCGTIATDDYRQDFNGFTALEPFQGYRAGDPKIKTKIDYRVYYSKNNSQKLIKKPLIIIDGFDPGDKRKIEDCDCAQIAGCASRYLDANGNFDPELHKSIVDFNIFYDNEEKKPLLPILREKGFDVIIVNFPKYTTTNLLNGQNVSMDGGAYYIESNANAIIKLLQDVKQQVAQNGSTSKTSIIAPSMAGQISRYALSFMEKKFNETNNPIWQHNVSLWVSVDSPHLGANIPLGDQALIYLLKNENDTANDFYNLELSSPASQQQLIEFHRPQLVNNPWYPSLSNAPQIPNYHMVDSNFLNGQTTTQGLPTNRGNTFFQEHYNKQNNNGLTNSSGWPQNLRKIAVANGSLTGSKETQSLAGLPIMNFAANGENVLNIRGFQRVHINLPIGSITFRVHAASLESYFMKENGTGGRISRFKKGFDDKTTIATNINPRGVMDNGPGGFFDAQDALKKSILSNTSGFINLNYIIGVSGYWDLRDFNPIHSFIPTFSSLAHLQPNQSWANPVNTNLACPTNKKTPFDSYFGIAKNTPHTSFTKECVDWLIKELDGMPQPPNFPLQESAISGSQFVCKNANTTFSIQDICKVPGIPMWSVEGNLTLVSSTDYTVTVTGGTTNNSSGNIVATFGTQVFKKPVNIGVPTYVS